MDDHAKLVDKDCQAFGPGVKVGLAYARTQAQYWKALIATTASNTATPGGLLRGPAPPESARRCECAFPTKEGGGL
jgi:hypothetical protein